MSDLNMEEWNSARDSHPQNGELVEVIRKDGLRMEWIYWEPTLDGSGGNAPIWEEAISYWRPL